MNEKRQKQKYNELLYNRCCLVLKEEAGVFRTYLKVKGIVFRERSVGDYHIEFERRRFV